MKYGDKEYKKIIDWTQDMLDYPATNEVDLALLAAEAECEELRAEIVSLKEYKWKYEELCK